MVRCPTEIDLERFLQGSCTRPESATIERHEVECPECAERLRRAREDDALLPDLRRAHSGGAPAADVELEEEPALARYRIVRRLGAGGMGVVYEAEQRNPQRSVALKVLASSFVTERALRRFDQEAEVLGRLVHPGIAQIHEAGAYESAGRRRPFFAMELVEGRELVEWADAQRLGLTARLELWIKVCDAVQHAHEKGVLHRDLKPANILVNASGQPKVLDFGVARLVDPEVHSASVRSEAAEVVGTLPYMSPEQLAGDPLEVDTRCDVYALGVLGYELLTGRLPFRLTGRSIPEALRVIEQQSPEPLGRADPRLAGDLETIVAKAMERDKARRYGSAVALAADLGRFLAREPISARPPSAAYHLRMFVRRNRGVVAGLSLAGLALLGGILTTSLQARRALRAEGEARDSATRALAQAATVRESNRFLQALIGFDSEDPVGVVRSGDTTLREVLGDAAGLLTREPFSDPETEAELRIAIGNAQRRFGLRGEAVATLERALELRLAVHGEDALPVAETLNTLGVARFSAGDSAGAIDDWRRALEIYRALGGGEPEKEATTRGNLGAVLMRTGAVEEAEAMLLDAIAVHEAELGPQTLHVAADLQQLAGLRIAQGRRAEAAELLERSVEVAEAIDQPDHPQSIVNASKLLEVLRALGRYQEAELLARDLLERTTRVHGEGSRRWGDAQSNLAELLRLRGDPAGSEQHALLAIEVYRRFEGARLSLANALSLLARMRLALGDDEGAEASAREAAELFVSLRGSEHVDSTTSGVDLAQALVRLGRDEEAAPLLRTAVERLPGLETGQGPHTRAATIYASLLLRRGESGPHVEELHRRALGLLDELAGEFPQRMRTVVLDNYAVYLLSIGDASRVAEAESMLREAHALALEAYGEEAEETSTIAEHLQRAVELGGGTADR